MNIKKKHSHCEINKYNDTILRENRVC